MADITGNGAPRSREAAERSIPAQVRALAEARGLGEHVDTRLTVTSKQVGQSWALAGVGLALFIPVDIVCLNMSIFSAGYSVLHALDQALFFVMLAGLLWGIRGLVIRNQANYLFTGGMVHWRRSGPEAIAWADAARLETVYQKRSHDGVGNVMGYRLCGRDGTAIRIPIRRIGGRDAFLDAVIENVRRFDVPVS